MELNLNSFTKIRLINNNTSNYLKSYNNNLKISNNNFSLSSYSPKISSDFKNNFLAFDSSIFNALIL